LLSELLPGQTALRRTAMPEKGSLTVREAGRKGGRRTSAVHGVEHFRMIGRRGGEATKERYGQKHYDKISHMGRQRASELVAQKRRTAKGK